MEYLDIYDESGNHIGKEERNKVHQNALWHKTVHCWLFDSDGYVYFQIRHDEKALYTTASGHVMAGETLEQGFAREILTAVEIDTKYAGYLSRQIEQIERERKLEEKKIPADLDYSKLSGLRLEAREKLNKIKPLTVGMASRISGVSPADITVLLLYLK